MNVYLDNAATTPTDKSVAEEMLRVMTETFGNASSVHAFGRAAMAKADEARAEIASYISAKPHEIYFTSGGTESDNWAIRGVAYANAGKGKNIVTTTVEHPAVLRAMKMLEADGFEVTYVPVGADGRVTAENVAGVLRSDTILVSVMYANNETGIIMPIPEIGALCKEKGIPFHSDAVQAAGSLRLDVETCGLDLCSVSAHKFYGPKGVGFLYVRDGVKIDRLIVGGHQERTFRAGTTNTAGVVGMASAMRVAEREREKNLSYVREIRDAFLKRVLSEIPDSVLNGDAENRLFSNANVCFYGVSGDVLMTRLDRKGIAVSTGAACSVGSIEPSHVLLSMGLSAQDAGASLRFTFGKYNTLREAEYVADVLKEEVAILRGYSSLVKKIATPNYFV